MCLLLALQDGGALKLENANMMLYKCTLTDNTAGVRPSLASHVAFVCPAPLLLVPISFCRALAKGHQRGSFFCFGRPPLNCTCVSPWDGRLSGSRPPIPKCPALSLQFGGVLHLTENAHTTLQECELTGNTANQVR